MEKEDHRYSGQPTVKQSYMREISVVCPKCSKEALVTLDNSWFLKNALLRCFHCMFSQRNKDLIRYALLVKRNCDNCGKPMEIVIPNQKKKSDNIKLPCPHCGIVRVFEPRNEVHQLVYTSNSKAQDPIFKLPLWFQTEIRRNVLWAFNREHLIEIRNYVASKLRERQTYSYTTMVEKLPIFIKEAKNREIILKAIDRLIKK